MNTDESPHLRMLLVKLEHELVLWQGQLGWPWARIFQLLAWMTLERERDRRKRVNSDRGL